MSSIKLGIAGLGTVGAHTVKIIQEKHADAIDIVAVSARSKGKDRGIDTSAYAWADHPVDLLDYDLDCVVELIGGEDGDAYDLVHGALTKGVHVVTANKALLAKHGPRLSDLARENNVTLAYEAAVVASVPLISTLQDLVQSDECLAITGVLNGTCNFMLTKMENEAAAYDDALKEAQVLGYAEADPSFDVGGFDAAHKLKVLTMLAFGVEADFHVSGIENVTLDAIQAAGVEGYRLMLLGHATKEYQTVQVFAVSKRALMAESRAVQMDLKYAGPQTFIGAGAGGYPTASSVMADIMRIKNGIHKPAFGKVVQASGRTIEPKYEMLNLDGTEYPILPL